MASEFLLKRWEVSVTWASGTVTRSTILAASRGKALATAWRSDAFCGSTFAQFLTFARAHRDLSSPSRWGHNILVDGKPAFFLGNNTQHVQFVYPDTECVLNAHPYDVLPVDYRPYTYRDRDDDQLRPVA